MKIPSIQPVILSHQIKKDGTVNVKIRITHKRKVKYLPTTIIAKKGDYDSEFKVKNSIIVKCADTLKTIDEIISDTPIDDFLTMDVNDVVKHLEWKMKRKEKFKLDFFLWAEDFIAKKPKYSGNNYKSAINSFARFLGRDCMDISEVTSSLMRRFQTYLEEKHGKDARAVSLYTSSIATIHAEARRRFNDNEMGDVLIKNPFAYYSPPKQKIAKKRCVEPETIQKLIDIRGSLNQYHRLAVDVFLLSFALMGTNIPDLYDAKKDGDVIYYNRTKTRGRRYDSAEMRIRLEPVCQKLFDVFKDDSGERAFNLYHSYTFYKSIADKANDRLKEVASIMGVPPFTMYSARHSFATISFSLGIPRSLISDMLCHVDPNLSVTDIYIKKDWSVLWEANRKVLESFDWSKFE